MIIGPLVEPNLVNIAHFITGRVRSAEPTKSEHAHPVIAASTVEVNAWSIYSRSSHLSELRNIGTTVHPGLEIENDVRELMSSHKELA